MCGIGGIMMYPKQRTPQQLEFIRELASELAIENQARGSHATGIATLSENGYDVLKHNIRAEELTAYDAWTDFLEKNITNKTYSILLHTRFATKGEPSNNDNNHPIVTATAIGVHNGMIYNDDKLFRSEGLYRQAQVDSEIIFRLADKELGNDRENTKNIAEKINGIFAVAYAKKTQPNILNYFRNSNPTTFAYIPELNITVFASIESYVANAIKTVNKSSYYFQGYSIETDNIKKFTPKYDTIMQFDMLENTPIQQLEQKPLSFKDNNEGWNYTYGYGWMDDDDWYSNYRGSRTEDTKITNPDINNIYDFIDKKNLEHLMSDEDFTLMIELLDLNEKNEWSKGYTAGRNSLDNDIKVIKEQKLSTELKAN